MIQILIILNIEESTWNDLNINYPKYLGKYVE